ncbi:MAG: hypothetical protein QM800_05720 [Paludibacter sp.]
MLENKDNELVDLHTELNFLDAYIFLLNIRFVGKLKVNINIPGQPARRPDYSAGHAVAYRKCH